MSVSYPLEAVGSGREASPALLSRPGPRLAASHSTALLLAALLAAVLALATVSLAATASPAAAQTGASAPPIAGVDCPETGSERVQGALLEQLIERGPGCFPTSAYTVDFDDGDWKALSRKALGSATEMVAGFARFVVGIGLWLVSWAFTFGFAARLADPAVELAGRYQSSFAAPLVHFALVVAAAYGGWHVLRGRLGQGLGEFGISLLVLTLAGTFMLARPKAFLEGSIKTVGNLSGAVVSTAVDCGADCQTVQLGNCAAGSLDPACTVPGGSVAGSSDPSTNPNAAGPPVPGSSRAQFVFDKYRGLIRPLERGIHQAFIEQPYELVQWGRFVESGVCRDRMNEILARSPGGERDQIVHIMANGKEGESAEDRLKRSGGSGFALLFTNRDEDKPDGQCDALYKFNRTPTMERLGTAGLTLVAALIVTILLVLVAGTIVAAQIVAVALIAILPFAVLGGVLPGGGRQAFWRWVSTFARALLAILAMSVCLTFLLVTSRAILATESSNELMVRLSTLIAVTITAFVARRRFLEAGQRLAASLGQKLGGMGVGGARGSSWVGPAAVGGLTGFALARQLREGAVDGQELTRPVTRTIRRRLSNRQQAAATARALGGGRPGGASGLEAAGAADDVAGDGSAEPQASGLGRAVRTGAKVAWAVSPLGAPVEVPRAYRAARQAASRHKDAVLEKVGEARASARSRRDAAWAYAAEGAANLDKAVPGAAARARARATRPVPTRTDHGLRCRNCPAPPFATDEEFRAHRCADHRPQPRPQGPGTRRRIDPDAQRVPAGAGRRGAGS